MLSVDEASGVRNYCMVHFLDVQCPELPPIPNGSIEYVENNDALSIMATYICNDSFYLNGNDERSCTTGAAGTSNGMWTGQEPQCVCELAILLLINTTF